MGAALIDVAHGRRGAHQILRWVSPEVREKVSVRRTLEALPAEAKSPAPPRRRFDQADETFARPRRVRAIRVGPQEFEASVVVDCGPRCRALALRLRKTRGQWCVVEADIG